MDIKIRLIGYKYKNLRALALNLTALTISKVEMLIDNMLDRDNNSC